jgi:protein-S-isoprenylcysteine O-methyltransferase Ste14
MFWLIAAGVCGVVAVVFAFRSNFENAFVAAALGSVAWFLNYRAQIKSRIDDEENS